MTEAEKRQKEREERIAKAKTTFPPDFFKRFGHEGPVRQEMTQLALEEQLSKLSSQEEFEDFILAMINSGYEVNDRIQNLEVTFYNMFMSPISTRRQKLAG